MEPNCDPLHELADAVCVQRHWRDVEGHEHRVSAPALEAILAALGHETGSLKGIEGSIDEAMAQRRSLPPMLVTETGIETPLPIDVKHAELTDANGATRRLPVVQGRLVPVTEPGYFDLQLDSQHCRLAVAPARCPLPEPSGRRRWGASVQIPALRGHRAQPFGNFAELAQAAGLFAQRGADALAINPVHAMFPGNGRNYSPYSPSSRIHLNGALGDTELLGLPPLPGGDGSGLIDWEEVLPRRLDELRSVFAALEAKQREAIGRDNASLGEGLLRHAIFDALYCRFRTTGAEGWQAWPVEFHDPNSAAVARFAAQQADEVEFHLFTQWLARKGLQKAQDAAASGGMAIGIVADLAVGVHPGGSDSWAMRQALLQGLSIGAPPDPLGPLGQNWCLTSFSPDGLRSSGYEPWIAILRSAFESAGGLRIDHAFGLARLWVIPEGGDSSQGAYLAYPFLDLLRLTTLEAYLAGAMVIAEDLGTSPSGFAEAIAQRNMPGMRVLWFERAQDNGYIGAHDYPPLGVAMTGTHDTQTVAGWWKGRDLDWADQLERHPAGVSRQKAEEIRDWDRGLLWSTIGNGGDRPAPDDAEPVVNAALSHISRTPCLLALAPLEDLLAHDEQPNLPGTTSEHPNWRRRLEAPLKDLLDDPSTCRRIGKLAGGRDPMPAEDRHRQGNVQ